MTATNIMDSTRYGSGWKDKKYKNWLKFEPKYLQKDVSITLVGLLSKSFLVRKKGTDLFY
jgi:hypothetical protein